jgi:hypothetical protein
MAIHFKTDHILHSIELGDFVEHCERYVDVNDVDSILAVAPVLKALANNRRMLIDHINKYFSDPSRIEDLNTYSSQSLILEERSDFYIRTNTWTKPTAYRGDDSWERTLYSYDYAHNHNFSLLTVGYFGSGYYTDIYDFDDRDVVGYAGEFVNFEFMERVKLDRGKVLFYRRVKDIHVQLPPDDISVSLNFMPIEKKLGLTEQYSFDLQGKTIRALVGSQIAQQVDMLQLAGCIGDQNTLDLILHVAMKHPNQNTRLGALHAASNLQPAESERFWNEGLRDQSDVVRATARAALLEAEGPMVR